MSYFPTAVNFRVSLEVFRDSRTGYINHFTGLLNPVSELETTPIGGKQEQPILCQ
jgi:hypothetical protein